MKTQLAKKIIPILIIFSLVSSPVIIPLQASAASINWENPNKNGDNPYKIKLTDTFNSKTLLDVVACTGVVDVVSTAVTGFVAKQAKKILSNKIERNKEKICDAIKLGAITAVAAALNLSLTDIAKETKCDPESGIRTVDQDVKEKLEEIAREEKKARDRRECLNGIAVTLAKNQLTAMTRYTLNWVTTGFSGDPMYVRNIDSFMRNMTNSIIEKELSLFKDSNYFPYAKNYTRSKLRYISMSDNFANSMKQTLTNYLDYGDIGGDTADVIKKYSNNFGMGGWDGWVAFTQMPQNNPLGSSVEMSNYLAEKVNTAAENTKSELTQGNGIFNQKKCVEYGKKLELPDAKTSKTTLVNGRLVVSNLAPRQVIDKSVCVKWENVTPGSVISSKINAYLGSPERQLELADTINDSLSVLFSVLIKVLQNEGLSSLSSTNAQFLASSANNSYNRRMETDIETGEVLTSSGYANMSVDLTKELGNTFVHDELRNLGSWDAKNNIPRLYQGIGDLNSFYVVSVAGNTELIKNGYNGWAVGDRVFFGQNGWQNWKKDKPGERTNPIKNRGIVQIQKDFIVGAKELLSIMPGIMPAIGELDYCIPGPNPSWIINSGKTEDSFIAYLNGLTTNYSPSGGFLGKRETIDIVAPAVESSIYKTYKDTFNGTGNLWRQVLETAPFKSIGYIANSIRSGGFWRGENDGNKAVALVKDVKEKISNDLELFRTKYITEINKIYGTGGLMQKQFIENENTYELKPNPSYLKMAATGLNITKDINSYAEETTRLIDSYRSDIIEANANIYKLNLIKDRVSVIIKQAQARRDKNRAEIIAKYNSENGTNLTIENYTNCIKEENISFYEDTDIFDGKAAGANERCNNNIDDDLDGLIDQEDPDCRKVEICGNGIDDDNDGAIDSMDSDCFEDNHNYGNGADYDCVEMILNEFEISGSSNINQSALSQCFK